MKLRSSGDPRSGISKTLVAFLALSTLILLGVVVGYYISNFTSLIEQSKQPTASLTYETQYNSTVDGYEVKVQLIRESNTQYLDVISLSPGSFMRSSAGKDYDNDSIDNDLVEVGDTVFIYNAKVGDQVVVIGHTSEGTSEVVSRYKVRA